MLPEIVLDDRRFQELVSEARTRIVQTCPEWTEHNVSDPGITLIELFAWMTEMLIYRVNRIPEKLHVALLNLLGMSLAPPSCATTEVRFTLAAMADERVVIPATETEVATLRTTEEAAIVFQVSESFTILPLRPAAYALQRAGKTKNVGVADGKARPIPSDQTPFGTPPQPGDGLLIGFEESIERLVMRVDVAGSEARGAGIDPDDPPVRWETSGEDGSWLPVDVLDDTTGGFNFGTGSITLQLPPDGARHSLAGERMYWLRCRVDALTRSGKPGVVYTHPPVIAELTAGPVGALLPVSHASAHGPEILGTSEGLPGAVFNLRQQPVLAPAQDEVLQVREPGGDWQHWELRESFASSGPEDPHYVLDLAHGEVELGPAIRQPNGSWRQYGAVPSKGSDVRMSGYRHGGGRVGNVRDNRLSVLKTAIPGVVSVSNPTAASGGVDAERVENIRARAALEFRARHRAVTAEDFEFLAVSASPRVARAICVPSEGGGPIRVHLLPSVEPADRLMSLEELTPSEDLLREVADYLDERRMVGTTVDLLPTRIRALTVVANIQVAPTAELTRVERHVQQALYCYLNPLIGGGAGRPGRGWPFGRTLNQGELFGVVHAVRGVEYVKVLRIYDTDLATGKQVPQPVGTHVELEPDQVIASASHIVKAQYTDG